MAMWATKTLYMVPNSNWTQANAKFAVYYYNNTTNGWSEFMTAVEGETNVFTTTVPDGYTSIIFCRMNSAATARNWDNKWNQSADLTLPDGKDLFVMADGWDGVNGTWQTYSAGTPIVVPTKSVPSEAPDVMLQAFYWDSYTDKGYGDNRWSTMLSQAEEIGSYFDLVWFPPCSQSSGGTGYIPKQYSNLNSDWGSESDLRALISALHNKGTRAVADIVINHVTGNYGWCSFATMNFGDYGTFNPEARLPVPTLTVTATKRTTPPRATGIIRIRKYRRCAARICSGSRTMWASTVGATTTAKDSTTAISTITTPLPVHICRLWSIGTAIRVLSASDWKMRRGTIWRLTSARSMMR